LFSIRERPVATGFDAAGEAGTEVGTAAELINETPIAEWRGNGIETATPSVGRSGLGN